MLQNFLKSRFSTAVLISLALGLVVASGYVIAGGSGGFDNQTNNIGNVENFNVINPENPNADFSLGAGNTSQTCTGNEDYTSMCNVEIKKLNITSTFISNATTTLPANTYVSGSVTATQYATSTVANPQEAAAYCNTTGVDLWVTNWWFQIIDNSDVFGANWTIGTTTVAGDLSYTATSTATLMGSTHVNTSTELIWDMQNESLAAGTYYEGTANATSTPFVLAKDVCILVTSDNSGATSTVTAFGEMSGRLYVETVIKP
jgi:hypothetical protein